MKTLILSCNTGQGHNAAGMAVYEELIRRGHACEFMDMISLSSENISKNISNLYVSITTKAPKVFQALYNAGGIISNSKHKSVIYLANSIMKDKVYEYIEKNNIDIIVMPHLFPAEVITKLKHENRLNAKTLAIATDYTCIPFWEETEPDYFVIPHKDLIDEFVEKGIPKEKLLPIGIPVSQEFSTRILKSDACAKLNLDNNKKNILIMSGSMGYGHIDKLIDALLSRLSDKINIIVLGGTNETLKTKLRQRFNNKNVYIIDFTKQVSLYMDACDILLTKPGGLTSTESAVKNIPTIFTNPMPGCETKNAYFFEQRNMAYYANNIESQVDYAEKLLTDESYKDMIYSQNQNINKNAAKDICDFIESW